MDGKNSKRREDVFSKPVRAGKRTYFFDVKTTKGDDYYLTITESKRRIDEDGKLRYDKHKLFIYKEDFEKFTEGLQSAIAFIRDEKGADYGLEDHREDSDHEHTLEVSAPRSTEFSTDISFDDLDDDK